MAATDSPRASGTSSRLRWSCGHTSETAIYTDFGSKEKLFSAAVAEPFVEFVAAFEARFASTPRDDAHLTELFVNELHSNLVQHRNAVTAFLISLQDPSAAAATGEARAQLEEMFASLNRMGREWDRSAGRRNAKGRVLVQRLMVGLIVAAVTFEEWLIPPRTDPSQVRQALTSL